LIQEEERLRKTNIEGTANIVNFCLAFEYKNYVSVLLLLWVIYRLMKNSSLRTEWNPELPHNDYAISKYGAEMEVWRGQQEGLTVIIINPVLLLVL
jgi:nucleoside-diphosphate-sugar epimerase